VTTTIVVLTFIQGSFHYEFHTYRYQLLHDLGIV
jgi:hypothetical protein